jgi:hypothetical protein
MAGKKECFFGAEGFECHLGLSNFFIVKQASKN